MTNNEFAIFYKSYVDITKKRSCNVDITYRCPLECPFCQRQREGAKQKISNSSDITFEDYNKLLSYFKNFNLCGQISDPIYHKNFLEILDLSRNTKQTSFTIHTNGTRKKLSWWKPAFEKTDSRFIWIFGLDGTDQETANIYRVNTRYDEVLEVMKLGAALGKIIHWQFIVFKHNEHQIEEARKIAKENNIQLIILKSSRWEEHKIVKEPSPEWKSKYDVIKQFIPIEVI